MIFQGHMNCELIQEGARNAEGKSTTASTQAQSRTIACQCKAESNWQVSKLDSNFWSITRDPVLGAPVVGKATATRGRRAWGVRLECKPQLTTICIHVQHWSPCRHWLKFTIRRPAEKRSVRAAAWFEDFTDYKFLVDLYCTQSIKAQTFHNYI